jgi:hypothetical protein
MTWSLMISHHMWIHVVSSCLSRPAPPEKDVATTIQKSSRIPKIAKEPDDKSW